MIRKNKQNKLSVLSFSILIGLILISSLFLLVSLGYFWLAFVEESFWIIFGFILMISSIVVLLLSIFTLKRKKWAKYFLTFFISFLSFYLLSVIIGAFIQKEFLLGIISLIVFIISIFIIYHFNGKDINRGFN
jgi:hypothetical protein